MTLALPKSVGENLRFLCVEVESQLTALQEYLAAPTSVNARRIVDRSGYSFNLKTRIHTSCINTLTSRKQNELQRLQLRCAEFIATDLERITELARECVKQMSFVRQPELLEPQRFQPALERIAHGVNQVYAAIEARDTQLALDIGKLENRVEKEYARLYRHYIGALKSQHQTEDLAQILFVAHSVQQMGDALRHISESIISANLGQPVNFERYFSLQSLVQTFESQDENISIEPLAETRSGSAISGVRSKAGQDYLAIYKDGIKRKVKEEREGVQSWHHVYPGLAPKILSYKKRGQSAALLIEHLPGYTFEQVLLNEPQTMVDEALKQLMKTLRSVWKGTRNQEAVTADFMGQLERRIGEVYKIHPEFQRGRVNLCGCSKPGFDGLVQQAAALEKHLQPPFSVYIHGDFNVDNIIYDPLDQRINFIDLHRSRYQDYVQDVSVFMVSNYRLQILDQPLRRRILNLAIEFYRAARRFARKAGDDSFELRLALGLARSFVTSTRFILDKALAQNMFLRATYLIEWVLECEAGVNRAAGVVHRAPKLPIEEIFRD
ncbi:PhoU domain-containing protein [Ketobacter sp.]|uniref:PhoU domain-containing protein n=1 Tax=Ketobacter sp. TaxID=2083498 RepID=UPI000F28C61A|nr:PhoU domain-containing protein [Ketobacter sp.]RLT95055.1 MAG: hypothetical protein D9N14_15235 [Ketobacter sp.]